MTLYAIYGLRLESEWPLPGYLPAEGPPDVRLVAGSPDEFHSLRASRPDPRDGDDWPCYAVLPDGSLYLRWGEQFAFRISADGRRVEGIAHPDASQEGFQTYLLGQVLSFILIQRGLEPLHATVVAGECGALAFIADTGVGKSTLAAAFVDAGHPLVTDDLMVLDRSFRVHPGPPRLKLFPDAAAAHSSIGGAPRMNPLTAKLVVSLEKAALVRDPVPLRAIYVLKPRPTAGSDRVLIRPIGGRRAFAELMKATYNNYVDTPERLRAQFAQLSALVARTPIRILSYPRRLEALPAVRRRVLRDACAG